MKTGDLIVNTVLIPYSDIAPNTPGVILWNERGICAVQFVGVRIPTYNIPVEWLKLARLKVA